MKVCNKYLIPCWTVIALLLNFSEAKNNLKDSRSHGKTFGKHPSSGLVSFNSEEGKLRIDWAVTIPFISIPMEPKIDENGGLSPLLNINTKALGIVGLITTLFSVISPLFSKNPHPQFSYRSEDNSQWSQIGNTVNEIISGNNHVTPCMQLVVCSIVSVATHSENPTSADKIIDGLSSHRWLQNFTNGTVIQDAIAIGKQNQDCARIYKNCSMTPKLLKIAMNEFGIV